MAQGFTAISTSLGEAERVRDGKEWTAKDYAEHQKHYNIDPARSNLNSVLISADGLNERDLVNRYMEPEMLAANQAQIDKVKRWNDAHSEPDPDNPGKTRMMMNPDKGKRYGKRSINKTRMFPVGAYKDKGTKQMPYDTFKSYIELGNARGKEADSTRLRTGVLQQYAVSWGNSDEWRNDPTRKALLDAIQGDDLTRAKQATQLFEGAYVKPFLEQFQKENPSLHVLQAVVHYDETNPHLQFSVMPHVAGAESGGLGSTSYTKALKTDHPELHSSKIIGEFYESQHLKLRDQIKTTKLGKSAMILGARPGSHKSHRVDQFARMEDDNAKQMQWLADATAEVKRSQAKAEAAQNKADADQQAAAKTKDNALAWSKESSITLIAGSDPSHRVPAKRNNGVVGEPISSDEGRKQHKEQSANWLVQTALRVAQAAAAKLQALKKAVKEREKAVKEREKEVKEREDRAKKREDIVKAREQEIKNRDKVFNRKMLDIVAPNMDSLKREELLNDGNAIVTVGASKGKIEQRYVTVDNYIGLGIMGLKKVRSDPAAPVAQRQRADERLARVQHTMAAHIAHEHDDIDWGTRFGIDPALVNNVKTQQTQQKQRKKVQQDDELEF